LRDFKETRYEDVLEDFAQKRAKKKGVAIPANFGRKIKKKKFQRRRKRNLVEQDTIKVKPVRSKRKIKQKA